MIRWLILSLFIANICANEFPVVIGETAYANMPGLAENVIEALQVQGINAKLEVVPGERALHLLTSGLAAIDIIRHPKIMEGMTNLTKIDFPVINIRFVRIVSIESAENCTRTDDDLIVVGVKGIRAFKGIIVPRYKTIVWVSDAEHAFRMLAAERGDITYWLAKDLTTLETEYADQLIICKENEVKFALYSYLNMDYKWALPEVEAAYKHLFGKP